MKRQKLISDLIINGALLLLCIIWTVPTFGLLVSSFRPRDAVNSSGWWTVVQNPTEFTLDNYRQVLLGKDVSFTDAEGNVIEASGDNLGRAFLNSLTVTI
ncbi:MAG: carbohydrate ABC transporter permease, partial [Anaerolineae bacterium]|nr:carbohydrate ABC transporter permease [Anaerolineae bacterium]